MLALDAMRGDAPAVWCVLTTRTASVEPRDFYRSREKLLRAIKRRWPRVEYVAVVEFTTGYGPRSGGQRRPHWNLLLKGVPAAAVEELEALVRRVWCSRVDATPDAQFVGTVDEVRGLMRYIALHFLKESQRPPAGWSGQRVTYSRGYFTDGVECTRADAQRALRIKRAMHRGLDPMTAALEVELADAETWTLIAVRRRHRGGLVEPVGPVEVLTVKEDERAAVRQSISALVDRPPRGEHTHPAQARRGFPSGAPCQPSAERSVTRERHPAGAGVTGGSSP